MQTVFNNRQTIATGTVLSATSYQGTVSYYQVVRATTKSCWTKEIAKIERAYDTFGSGASLPVKYRFIDDQKPQMHRILAIGDEQCVKLSPYLTARPWDGTVDYY